MKFLMLTWRLESGQLSLKNHLFYSFVIESLCLSLLCLSAALLCYTGLQNYRKVYSDFNTVFVPLLLLAAGVGFPAACF